MASYGCSDGNAQDGNDMFSALDNMCGGGAEEIEIDHVTSNRILRQQDAPMAANDSLALEGFDAEHGQVPRDTVEVEIDDDEMRGNGTEGILVDDVVEDEKRRGRKQKFRLGGALCLTIMVIAVLVSLLVTQTGSDNNGSSRAAPEGANAEEDLVTGGDSGGTDSPVASPTEPLSTSLPTSPPTVAPTAAPTMAPTTALQGSAAFQIIAPLLDDPSKLLDPDSAQHQALQLVVAENRTDEFGIVQRFSMMSTYHDLSGDTWGFSHGWKDFAEDECLWYGVQVCRYQANQDDHAASSLGLGNNGLTGKIPAEMCLLRNLEGLSLDSNELHGELPSCLANLRKLDVLELQSNMLTGTLDALFQLDGMTVTPTYAQLRLDNNDFSGTIPEAIQYLNDLTVLTLHGNPQLTGSLNALCDGRAMMEITADCANVDCSCCTCY